MFVRESVSVVICYININTVVNISSATLEIAVIMSTGDTTICAACHENITDKAMKAKNNFYHENHFVCSYSGCGLSLLKLSVYSK